MKVLQLGPNDWSLNYEIPESIDWEINDFPLPKKKRHSYDVVILTGAVELSDQLWEMLRMSSTPYAVLYLPGVPDLLDERGKRFLKEQAAIEITQDPQTVINDLPKNFYFGQTGIRISPTNLVINRMQFPIFEYVDGYHLKIDVKSDEWQTVGTYKTTPYYDPNFQLSLWLECTQNPALETRLIVYNMEGNADERFIMPLKPHQQEMIVPMGVADYARFIGVSIQVRGHGPMEIGTFHYRWTRHGFSNYIAGGKEISQSRQQ